MTQPTSVDAQLDDDLKLAERLRQGDRYALARIITLIESTRIDHQRLAERILTYLLPYTGQSLRLGISGVPGVGKSCLIEALGLYLINQGKRVAVLAIDPSSSVSGGSILGDKTRMEKLSIAEQAFIRPSPNCGVLGGVTRCTRESILACEAAGFDIVIVETVGVGQSEIAVANLTDCFVLLQMPYAGDDLQAIKKGIVELADVIVYNKIDLNIQAAQQAIAQMTLAMKLLHRPIQDAWHVPVIGVSALTQQGIEQLWNTIQDFQYKQQQSGALTKKRQRQHITATWELIDQALRQNFCEHPVVASNLNNVLTQVEQGQLNPEQAARDLLSLFSKRVSNV